MMKIDNEGGCPAPGKRVLVIGKKAGEEMENVD
jgi:hypothetical protein